jgi:hypothetical protein
MPACAHAARHKNRYMMLRMPFLLRRNLNAGIKRRKPDQQDHLCTPCMCTRRVHSRIDYMMLAYAISPQAKSKCRDQEEKV